MSRKIAFTAFAVALTLVVADTQAFAKGGKGGGSKGGSHATHSHRTNHKGGRFDRHFGHRNGWGYGSYGVDYASYPVVVDTPVVDDAPVAVDAMADLSVVDAPVIDTPVVADSFGYFAGHRGHGFHHNHGHIGGHRGGHGKK
jgi:hypothetical protein